MILVLDNYDSFTYNLVQLIGALDYQVQVERNNEVTVDEIRDLAPEKIVISPGPGRPEEAGISLAVVEKLAGEIPILGICLGYQVLGAAFGGRIKQAPELVHGKTSRMKAEDKSIMQGLDEFKATRYHSLVIEEASLADRFEVIVRTSSGLLMGIADEESQLYGLQFHPESIMTEKGQEIVNNFLELIIDN